MIKNYFINKISKIQQNKLKQKINENYDYYSISEYESVYQDILDYEDNNYENWTLKDFIEFTRYLKELIK